MRVMNKILLTLLFGFFLVLNGNSQVTDSSYFQIIHDFQSEMNEFLIKKETSPFTNKKRKKFTGLKYYPTDISFCIKGHFMRTPGEQPFRMKTTTEYRPLYIKYGIVRLQIKEYDFTLNVYQNLEIENSDRLFILFTDNTNGRETYSGGRYIDVEIPMCDTLLVDFNKSYNPLCHYNPAYSCPVPPLENHIDMDITAGVKLYDK